jgi:CheY-like chemotaxis protein
MISTNVCAKGSVLIIEDESLVRMMAVDMFEQAGFHVLEAENCEDATRTLATLDSIDGLFVDVGMPGAMDGLQFARASRALHPEAAIMIVSSRAPPAMSALPARARFVAKPYDNVAVLQIFDRLRRTIGETGTLS